MRRLLYKLRWLKILNSPFKVPSAWLYFGKIKHGTPYFLPRKWINMSDKRGYQKAIPLKLGIQIIGLGWKTKFDKYRHEWNPMISAVGFNRQFCIWFGLKETMSNMCYWEAWLTYFYDTDKSNGRKERLSELREKYSANWGNKDKGYTDYYPIILKNNLKYE